MRAHQCNGKEGWGCLTIDFQECGDAEDLVSFFLKFLKLVRRREGFFALVICVWVDPGCFEGFFIVCSGPKVAGRSLSALGSLCFVSRRG